MYEEQGTRIMTSAVEILIGYEQTRSAQSITELDQILDETANLARSIDDPVAVTLYYAESSLGSEAALFLGLGRDWSILEWGSPDIHLYVPGDEDGGKPSAWWYSCDYSQYPPGRGVPIEIVRAAAREFVRTIGQKPAGLLWKVESAAEGIDPDSATLAHAS